MAINDAMMAIIIILDRTFLIISSLFMYSRLGDGIRMTAALFPCCTNYFFLLVENLSLNESTNNNAATAISTITHTSLPNANLTNG